MPLWEVLSLTKAFSMFSEGIKDYKSSEKTVQKPFYKQIGRKLNGCFKKRDEDWE